MAFGRTWLASAAAIAVAGIGVAPALAVVVDGNTSTYSTYNTNAPSGIAGFNNVGTVNGSTGVYLGNGWVITASHVGSATFQLPAYSGSTTYSVIGGSAVQLKNADNSNVDLTMFKINNAPALPTLTIGSSAPSVGTSLYLVGNGYNRKDLSGTSDKVYYSVTGSGSSTTWTQLPNSVGANASGYQLDTSAQAVRYGQASTVDADSTTSGNQSTYTINDGYGTQPVFTTVFQDLTGNANAVSHDSGGGIFDSSNALRGIIIAMATYQNQPSDTAIFGDQTDAVDLSAYRSQINAIMVPEPAMLGILGLLGVFGLRRRRA